MRYSRLTRTGAGTSMINNVAMNHESVLRKILSTDPLRQRILSLVHLLGLPDCWIGAGFIRNAVWDHLHGRPLSRFFGDVDVIWFHHESASPAEDRELENRLQTMEPSIDWSVKNQARMHLRNDDPPYASAADAMRYWPETATAIAARRTGQADCEIAAPFGLDDLFALVLRPTPHFAREKRFAYIDRVRRKGWLETWPLLHMEGV